MTQSGERFWDGSPLYLLSGNPENALSKVASQGAFVWLEMDIVLPSSKWISLPCEYSSNKNVI